MAERVNYRARRRAAWLAANGPCQRCGSWERLEVDHIDPAKKTIFNSARLWDYSEKKRTEELANCQALCHVCHKKKTCLERGSRWLEPDEYVEFWRLVLFENYGRYKLMERFGAGEGKVRHMLRKGPRPPVQDSWIEEWQRRKTKRRKSGG